MFQSLISQTAIRFFENQSHTQRRKLCVLVCLVCQFYLRLRTKTIEEVYFRTKTIRKPLLFQSLLKITVLVQVTEGKSNMFLRQVSAEVTVNKGEKQTWRELEYPCKPLILARKKSSPYKPVISSVLIGQSPFFNSLSSTHFLDLCLGK